MGLFPSFQEERLALALEESDEALAEAASMPPVLGDPSPVGVTRLRVDGDQEPFFQRRAQAILQRWSTQSRRLVGTAQREVRTGQELLVADMLRAIGIPFREQVPFQVERERLIFDFLVEQTVLVECTCSRSPCNRAWEILRLKLAYADYKFRIARQAGTFRTIALIEALRCPAAPFPYPDMPHQLAATDHLVFSIPQLGHVLIELLAENPRTAQPPATEERVERWLATGTSNPRKTKQRTSRFEKLRRR